MTIKTVLPISTCWIVTEGLIGLQNQAIGLAQALGVSYVVKEVKKPKGIWRLLFPSLEEQFTPPWPDLLISCGRQSVAVSLAIRRASGKKTFTVHIQDPLIDPEKFDVVVVPAHDKLRGKNVLVTQGAIHRVNLEKLINAADQFRRLVEVLPHPLISVLVGGKNRHQGFSAVSAHDFAGKLQMAATNIRGGLAVTFSRRTGAENEAILRKNLAGVPSYIWDGQGENPYFGLLALAEAIIVTCDSISMISEACSTGKPVYIYELPNCGRRHKKFCESLIHQGLARPFLGTVESWEYMPLNDTYKAAEYVHEHYISSVTT